MAKSAVKRCLGLFVSGALLSACFDVHQVDVADDQTQATGLLIDDFEDGDWFPDSPLFLHWFCVGAKECSVSSPGENSAYGYGMAFDLQDPLDGKLDYPSARVATWRSGARLDFTRYKTLSFSVRLAPGEATVPDSPVDVELLCPLDVDTSDRISFTNFRFQPSQEWLRMKLSLVDFAQPSWSLEQGEPVLDAHACLTHIDGLGFSVSPTLEDGQRAAATLMIDHVYLQ